MSGSAGARGAPVSTALTQGMLSRQRTAPWARTCTVTSSAPPVQPACRLSALSQHSGQSSPAGQPESGRTSSAVLS